MFPIDVALVSGRRPELLARTMESFERHVFRYFTIANFFVNIDPFGGGSIEAEECGKVIRTYFPAAQISEPEKPSFGLAVKSLWGRTMSPYVLHLEDDWLVLEDLNPERIFPYFHGTTAAVRPLAREHNWKGPGVYSKRRYKIKFLGITLAKQMANQFGTSPSFLRGEFARHCSALMNPNLDPEKQMSPRLNRRLFAYQNRYRCRFLSGTERPEVIRDIGREWRSHHGITKIVANGQSIWSAPNPT